MTGNWAYRCNGAFPGMGLNCKSSWSRSFPLAGWIGVTITAGILSAVTIGVTVRVWSPANSGQARSPELRRLPLQEQNGTSTEATLSYYHLAFPTLSNLPPFKRPVGSPLSQGEGATSLPAVPSPASATSPSSSAAPVKSEDAVVRAYAVSGDPAAVAREIESQFGTSSIRAAADPAEPAGDRASTCRAAVASS